MPQHTKSESIKNILAAELARDPAAESDDESRSIEDRVILKQAERKGQAARDRIGLEEIVEERGDQGEPSAPQEAPVSKTKNFTLNEVFNGLNFSQGKMKDERLQVVMNRILESGTMDEDTDLIEPLAKMEVAKEAILGGEVEMPGGVGDRRFWQTYFSNLERKADKMRRDAFSKDSDKSNKKADDQEKLIEEIQAADTSELVKPFSIKP